MKHTLIILFILLSHLTSAQSVVNLKYYDNCKNSVVDLAYDLLSLESEDVFIYVNDSTNIDVFGAYIITVYRNEGEYYSSYDFTKVFDQGKIYIDTIEVPKIAIWHNSDPKSSYWRYQYCNRICDGYEVDYYRNGNIWIEGTFINGKPKRKVSYYSRKGNLIRIDIYNRKGYKRSIYPDYEEYINNN